MSLRAQPRPNARRNLGTLRLGMALNDTIRSDAAKVVEELNSLGCEPVMLTGDAEAAGRHVSPLQTRTSVFSFFCDLMLFVLLMILAIQTEHLLAKTDRAH